MYYWFDRTGKSIVDMIESSSLLVDLIEQSSLYDLLSAVKNIGDSGTQEVIFVEWMQAELY